jgi:hypothetical protein
MNTPVSFPVAKLLKEKGFDIPTKLCVTDDDGKALPFDSGNKLHINNKHPYYSAPIIADVVMWLYETYGIWISVYEYKDHAADVNDSYVFRTSHTKLKEFNSPTEAYEAVILYCLNNLV